MNIQRLHALYKIIMHVLSIMRLVMWWVIVIVNIHVNSDSSSSINMSRTTDSCTKNLAVLAAPEVLAFLCKLETKNDPRRTSSEVPDLCTAAQQHDFCEVYYEVLRHYQILAAGGNDDVTRRAKSSSVN